MNELQLLAFLAAVSVRLSIKRKKASLRIPAFYLKNLVPGSATEYLNRTQKNERHLNTEAKTLFMSVFPSH